MSAEYLKVTEPYSSLISDLVSSHAVEMKRGWEFVYKTYFPMVRDAVRKNSGTEEAANDIFQEGLIILHSNLINGRFREESLIKTYIFSICKNLWLKELSRRQKEIVSLGEIVEDSHLVADYLIDVEVVTLLMHELKKDCHDILIEYYFNERSMAELKDIFNVNSVQAAKNKKHRCLQFLKQLTRERGIGPGLKNE